MNAVLQAASGLLFVLTGMVSACPSYAESTREANSNTVIGPNVMLAEGATAMMNGQWEQGVLLTQMGIMGTVSNDARAAGYANLCAGYVALKKYEQALENCNRSIALFGNNWRAWQNRAAANMALGRMDQCMRDIEQGLTLNPESQELQKTLAIARGRERLQQERLNNLLES